MSSLFFFHKNLFLFLVLRVKLLSALESVSQPHEDDALYLTQTEEQCVVVFLQTCGEVA